ncbi:MAG: hypothetical protein AABY16_02170 [Nanoarchaeota archaeon]
MRVKADLCVAPHFYSPQDSKRAPSLKQIVEGLSKKDLDVVALTSCHTATSGIDNRWRDYMGQLSSLGSEWEIQYDEKTGVLNLQGKESNKRLLLVHTQIVRAYDGKNPADLNVFGVGKIIQPSRDIAETAKEVKGNGGFVLVRDPGAKSSAKLEKALELYESGAADGIQISATTPDEQNQKIIRKLSARDIKAFPASNAKRYQDAGTSYATFKVDKVDIRKIGQRIRGNNFEAHYGQISPWQRFWSRDIYILLSWPGHYLAGGKRKDEFLKATGLKKK